MIDKIFLLLILFQAKHFIADFPLQNAYMLGKMKKHGWVIPLAAHALVHACLTLLIVLATIPSLWWLAIVDFVVHFSIDRIKASPNLLNRWEVTSPCFWWVLGADQLLHHLTNYAFIYIIVTY